MKRVLFIIVFLLGIESILYGSYYWDYPKWLEDSTLDKKISDLKVIRSEDRIIIFYILLKNNSANIEYWITDDLQNFKGPFKVERNIEIKEGFYPGYDVHYFNGKILLVYNDIKGNIYSKISSNNGKSWGNEKVLLSFETFSFKPMLFVIGDKVFLFYHSESKGRRIDFFYIKTANLFKTHSPPVQIAQSFAGSFFPSIAFHKDRLWVAWQSRPFTEKETPVFDIYLSISKNFGNSWEDPINLTRNSISEDIRPFIHFLDDSFNLIWESDRGGAWGVYFGGYDLSSKALSRVQKINRSLLNAKEPGIIYIGKEPYIFYLDNRDGNYRIYFSKTNGKEFKEEGPVTQTGIDIIHYTPITLNNDIYLFCESKRGICLQGPDRNVKKVEILPFKNTLIGEYGRSISWKEPRDSSGIEGYCYSFNNKKIDEPEIVNIPKDILSMKLRVDKEGEYFFHIRAKDKAGNLAETVTIPFIADLTPPPGPSISLRELDEDGWLKSNRFTIKWSVDASDVVGYNYALSHRKLDLSNRHIRTSKTRKTKKKKKNGTWYFNVAAIDRARNVGKTSHFKFKLRAIVTKPEEKKWVQIAPPWIFSSETFKASPILNILLFILLGSLLFISFTITIDILIKYIKLKKEVYMDKEGYAIIRKKRLGLRFKFSILIGILVLILTVGISAVLSYVTIENEKIALSNQMMDKAKLSIENMTNVAREGILNNDELFLLSVIKKTMENRDIKYSIILNINNGVIAHSDINKRGEVLQDEFTLKASKSDKLLINPAFNTKSIADIYDLSNPILFANKRIGTVRIGYSTESIFNTINENRRNSLYSALIVTVITIIIGILGAIIMTTITIRPIKILADGANIIGGGNLEHQIEVKARDEIGLLADEFNRMTKRLSIYQKEMQKKAKLDEQLEIARNIQENLIPRNGIDIDKLSIDGYYKAASEVGGDYYDFIRIDKNRYGLIISDVAGKGVPASLMMTMIRAVFRSLINSGAEDPSKVVNLINKTIVSDMSSDRFATVMFGIYNLESKLLRYTNAGYGPLLIYKGDKKSCSLIESEKGSIPIGVMPDVDCLEENPIRIESGDALILFTDGIHEARNVKEEEYGIKRLAMAVPKYAAGSAKEISNSIIEDVVRFMGDAEQYDDMTLMVMKAK